MSYILGNIDLNDYGIIPSVAPNSNIALEGCFDFPKRIGETSHSWDDEDGDEPFVDADDLCYEGRTIKFYGFIEEGQDSYDRLQQLYSLIAEFTDLVAFQTPHGDFNVLVKKIIPQHINNVTKIKIEMREPVVDMTGVIPATANDNYMIDGIPLKSFGLYISQKEDFSDLSESKEMQFRSYGFEGYQMTKRKANAVSIQGFIVADDITDFKAKVNALYAVLGSSGLREFTAPLQEESIILGCYSTDGFSISNLLLQSEVSAKISFKLDVVAGYIKPPVIEKLSAYFYKTSGSKIIDAQNGYQATISGTNITFPDITGNDLFDFSDATYWDQTVIAATGWYNAGAPRTCPLTWLVGATWAEAATDATHARLFHRDYDTKLRDVLPVLVYAQDLTPTEQQTLVDWLDWYATIWQESAMLTENDNPIVQ